MRRTNLWIGSLALLSACSGLSAGPEVVATTPVPASRDSAYTRARRALAGESFTPDVVDSTRGRLTAMRYPSSNVKMGSAAACRLKVGLDITGDAGQAEVKSNSRWIAAEPMLDKAPTVCEQERQDVLGRLAVVMAPPQAK